MRSNDDNNTALADDNTPIPFTEKTDALNTHNTHNTHNNQTNPTDLTDSDSINATLEDEALNETLTRQQTMASFIAAMEPERSKKSIQLPPFGGGKSYPPHVGERKLFQVDFDGPKDPANPINWPMRRKLGVSVNLVIFTVTSTFTSSVYAADITDIMREFHVGEVVAILGISLYVVGYATGPVLWGPLSELWGRKLPLIIGSFGFFIFQFACATSKDYQTLMLTRFFGGFFGACPLAVVAASFTDMFTENQRGYAIGIFGLCVFMGPMLAPIIGGFIAKSFLGWRWTEYICGMMGAAAFCGFLLFGTETFPPIILSDKARLLRQETGNWAIHAPFEAADVDFKDVVNKTLTRPLRMLFTEPILFLVSLYTAFVYGILYLFLDAYPIIFGPEGYGWSLGVLSLPYIGLIVGEVTGLCIMCYMEYRRIVNRRKETPKDAGFVLPKPEQRLPPMMVGAICFPIGIFWLCWTGAYYKHVSWLAPAFSGIFSGIGFLLNFIPAFNYIIDSYLVFAASAIAGNTFLRSGFGCAFPLFGAIMFRNLGTQWAGTLLGCFAVLIAPIPFLFYFFGEKVRAKSRFNPENAIKAMMAAKAAEAAALKGNNGSDKTDGNDSGDGTKLEPDEEQENPNIPRNDKINQSADTHEKAI